jgi:hypothetical protein
MNEQSVDATIVRTTAFVSRRTSVIGIGAAALAAVRPSRAKAGKAGRRAKKTCKKQIDKCQSSVTSFCGQPNLNVSQEVCEAAILPCCSSFKRCKAGTAYDCIVAALLSLVPA